MGCGPRESQAAETPTRWSRPSRADGKHETALATARLGQPPNPARLAKPPFPNPRK
jgi:hypothetical protein